MQHEAKASSFAVADLAQRLRDDGFLILRNIVPRDEALLLNQDLQSAFEETPFSQGGFYGALTKRFGRLLIRSGRSADFVTNPLILAISEAILGPFCDNLQLNLTQGLSVHPGAPVQPPHRDQDMWGGETGRIEYLVNVMWPFTDYTAQNGATRIWPGSHGAGGQHVGYDGEPIVADMVPGDALLFLGSTLHGAGANRSATARRGMIVSYCLGWLKPYENQWLSYPPDVAQQFPSDLAALVGYRQHRPNLGNVEGRCPSHLLSGGATKPLGAIDELRPDQADMVAQFVEANR